MFGLKKIKRNSMKTTSKIILGSEIDDFDIKKGSLYVKHNSNVIVMASQESGKSNQFCGMIVSGNLDGWGFGHYCTVWFKEEFKPFEGIIQIEQTNKNII